MNIGEIESEGVEADLGINWFRAKDEGGFSWSTNLNFTAYETTVLDLGLDTDQVIYSGFSNLGNAALVGEPLGVFFGSRILRDANGDFVVGADGNYVQDPNDGIIGDPNPDWVANVRNSISYKNFTLGFQWNYTQGGDVYSSTISTLMGRGLITETALTERILMYFQVLMRTEIPTTFRSTTPPSGSAIFFSDLVNYRYTMRPL